MKTILLLFSLITLNSVLANPVGKALILIDNPASNDRTKIMMKHLADLGLEYDFVFQNSSAPSDYNLDNSSNNILVDSSGKAKYDLLVTLGGGAVYTANTFANIREYVKGGGSYYGSCMGIWNAAYGYYYTGNPNGDCSGLLGQKANGDKGDNSWFSVRGYQLNLNSAGSFRLNTSHPVASGLSEYIIDGAKYYGSGFFEDSKSGYWTSSEWNKNIRIIAYNHNFPATVGSDANFGATVNGTISAVEYFPDDDENGVRDSAWNDFGRVVGSATHPEHLYKGYPLLFNMFKYAAFGTSLTDSSGNNPPTAEFTLSDNKIVYNSGYSFTATASNANDVDEDNVTVQWCENNLVIRTDENETKPLATNWNGNGTTYNANWGSATTPRRILMRVKDDGTPPRISERSRMLAMNNDSDGLTTFTLTAHGDGISSTVVNHGDTINLEAGSLFYFSISNIGGDNSSGYYSFDFGDSSYYINVMNSDKGTYYFNPGVYYATAGVKDNDNNWNLKSVKVVVTESDQPSLKMRLKFDDASGATTASDNSGNGNSGSVGGNVSVNQAGINGKSFEFKGGTGDAAGVKVGNISKSYDDLSLVLWFNRDSVSGYEDPFVWGKPTPTRHIFQIYMRDSGANRLAVEIGNYNNGEVINLNSTEFPNSTYLNNRWHMLTVTKEGTTLKLYLDGVLKKTGTAVATFNPLDDITIGYAQFWENEDFNGKIDDVRIYDYSLDSTAINSIFDNFKHSVTFQAAENGSVTGTKSQKIADGKDCSQVIAVPDTAYSFNGWTGDATSIDNPFTLTNVTKDLTLTANFELLPEPFIFINCYLLFAIYYWRRKISEILT